VKLFGVQIGQNRNPLDRCNDAVIELVNATAAAFDAAEDGDFDAGNIVEALCLPEDEHRANIILDWIESWIESDESDSDDEGSSDDFDSEDDEFTDDSESESESDDENDEEADDAEPAFALNYNPHPWLSR
jgi:hypothetical protein